jgi:uncharacterized protein YbjT (DUF2867 family)
MRLLVLGASGGCGRWTTQLAAADGHDVTALVRPETAFDAPRGVTVERGSALDPDCLARVCKIKDVVISCVGPQRANPSNPWSPLRPPPNVAEKSARAAIGALEANGLKRFVAISAAGVGDSASAINPIMTFLIRRSTVGVMYADLDRMEQVLRQSQLDWYAVRPVTLVNRAPSSRTREIARFGMTTVIGRADVASYLLRVAIGALTPTSRTPMIGWG